MSGGSTVRRWLLTVVGLLVMLPANAARADDAPSVVATITVGTAPWGVAFSTDGTQAYVGNSGSGSVSVIDVATRQETARLIEGTNPAGVAVTPDGASVLVADYGALSVLFIDRATSATSVQGLTRCFGPLAIAMRDDGAGAYVGCQDTGDIAEVSIPGRAVTVLRQPTYQGSSVRDIAYVPKGARSRDDIAYLLNITQNPGLDDFGPIGGYFRLHFARVGSATVELSLPGYGLSLAVNRAGDRAYVGDQSGNLSILAIATDGSVSLLNTILLGGELGGIALSPDERRAYVSDRVGDRLLVVDLATDTVLHTIPVGRSALRVAVSPDGRTVLVTNNGTNTVSVIDVPQSVVPAAPIADTGLRIDCEGPVRAVSSARCTVSGAPAGIDLVWRAAYNPVFAEGVVRTDRDGTGAFSFVVPGAAVGSRVTVEFVDWTAPVTVGTAEPASGPVPTSVPSGGGPSDGSAPLTWTAVLGVAVALLTRPRRISPRRR